MELKTSISDSARVDLANITKMLVYLLVNTVKVIDIYMNNCANDGGKGNKKVRECYSIVIIFYCLCSVLFFLSKLWTMKLIIGYVNVKMD